MWEDTPLQARLPTGPLPPVQLSALHRGGRAALPLWPQFYLLRLPRRRAGAISASYLIFCLQAQEILSGWRFAGHDAGALDFIKEQRVRNGVAKVMASLTALTGS